MSRLMLPIIAVVLVGLAVGGVGLGIWALVEKEEARPAEKATSAAPEEEPDSSGSRSAPAAAETSPESLIRFGITEPPAKPDGAIRLATYNVANLFDGVDDPSLSGPNEDIDDEKPEAQLAALADTIRRLDADILALQEIESEQVITAFRGEYLADAGYAHLASIDAGDERGIEQAVLSRFPITSVENWPGRELGGVHPEEWGDDENYNAGEPIAFHRSPLRVRVEIPTQTGAGSYELTLYVVHAKSGGPGEYWRQAEASGLVPIVREQLASDPHANIAILGDFNAFLTDGSAQTIVAAGFTDALADVYERGPRFVTHESGRRIDHILVNANLGADLAHATGFVLGTPALPEGMDWREEWCPEGYASDHYPVAVDFRPAE
ncbi:MAG TPA: endonuclease/exonuclease/phosphatase family protein [Phycisphaerales bacterium]|nr:endonuclease/exonuclease/phosphatase family protein [Phycisphaerales bacterium]